MAGGTFAESHGSSPGQQPQGSTANMRNQCGRIGHCPFLEIYTWTEPKCFTYPANSCLRGNSQSTAPVAFDGGKCPRRLPEQEASVRHRPPRLTPSRALPYLP